MASDDTTTDAPVTAEPAAEKAAAPRKRATRSATRRKVTAERTDPTPSPDDAAALPAVDEASAASAEPASRPAKRTARKRATKKTAAPAVVPVEEDVTPVATDTFPAAAVEGASDPDPYTDVAHVVLTDDDLLSLAEAAAASTGGSGEPADDSAEAARFGLLFQAPDPTPRRRRRVTAEAGAPTRSPRDTTLDDVSSNQQDQSAPARPGRDDAATAGDPDDGDPATNVDGDGDDGTGRRRRRRGGKGRRRTDSDESESAETGDGAEENDTTNETDGVDSEDAGEGSGRRRRRRRRAGSAGEADDPPGTVTRVRESRRGRDEATGIRGSTRLEAKRQRRREGREAGRRRTVITEAEFLARRESVERVMVVRQNESRTQIAVLEDGILVEHYVSSQDSSTGANGSGQSIAGNVYLGRVQNVLPSMEAAFIDIGKGRNAVLYAGEVNWDAAGMQQNSSRRIEQALSSGQSVLVQVTKDPVGHKGARLTSQISIPGRFLVYVPEGNMTGISRKLPENERTRLKRILKEIVPDKAGVIVRTAAEGASEAELTADVQRLTKIWEQIQAKAATVSAPSLLHGEVDLTVKVVRDIFNEDFAKLVVAGDEAWSTTSDYIGAVAPDLVSRCEKWTSEKDIFSHYRVDEQLAKAMDRKVWLPSGGSLVLDRTEAMTVIDVNTGKFVGAGGNLEETVTKNNIEAAEEIVRQLRLRDVGGIIVIDFIDMVLESNRDLVVRRLLECLGRDRTKHQVAEVTSLGLVQMTRKRVGAGLIEVFSESCEHCAGRGIIVSSEPIDRSTPEDTGSSRGSRSRRGRGRTDSAPPTPPSTPSPAKPNGPTPAQIAAQAYAALHPSEDQDPSISEGLDSDGLGSEGLVSADVVDHTEPETADPGQAADPGQGPATDDAPEPRRRKRGRVVAAAGAPGAVTPEVVATT